MRWTVLTDNRTVSPLLETEHGLAILLDTGEHRILLDTGASSMFLRNAARLKVDLSTVDYVFISHGHWDHAGGLRAFLEVNSRARVILSPDAVRGKFFSRRGRAHSITADWPEIPAERMVWVERSCEVAPGLHVMAHIPQVHPTPLANQNLMVEDCQGCFLPDDFRHELALYAGGLLFTGCAHSGLENILEACPGPVRCVVGGFHLLDGYESEEVLRALAERLLEKYPDTHFYTSHCTGDRVFQLMKLVMGEQLHGLGCGLTSNGSRQ